MERCVVIDGLPQTNKTEKIVNVMTALLSKIGPISKIQYDSQGFLFCQFETAVQAKIAIKKVDNYALDKVHTLKVNALSDIEYALTEPVLGTYVDEEDQGDLIPLNGWMQDGRDQFAIVKGNVCEVAFVNGQPLHTRKTDAPVAWSPLGTFLVSTQQQGLVLSGRDDFSRVHAYNHPGVKLFDVSQDERFLTTWSPLSHPETGHNLFLWDLERAVMIKSFNADASIVATTVSASTKNIGTVAQPVQFPWPLLCFSPCSQYCARQTSAGLTLYMLPSMQLQKIKVENLTDWSFSPSTPTMLVYTQQSQGDIPSRTTLLTLSPTPDAGEPWTQALKTRSLFNVSSLKTEWHPKSRYLLQYMSRKKTKTQYTSTIEIYRLEQKSCPVDVLDAQNDVTDMRFSYEDKIALIGSGELRIFDFNKNLFSLVSKFASKCQKLAYASTGFLAAYSGTTLEFYDSSLLKQVENNGVVEWDEHGRYAVAITRSTSSDPGYTLFDCSGEQLHRSTLPLFEQFLWRPRAGVRLTPEEKLEVEQRRQTWTQAFESEDRKRGRGEGIEKENARKEIWKAWVEFRETSEDLGFANSGRLVWTGIGMRTAADL